MVKRIRRNYSEKIELINKSRESALSAVQIFNNPLIHFKTESFIVLMNISWTYLLHAYYREQNIEYKHHEIRNTRKKFLKNMDGTYKYWGLTACLNETKCPLDKNTINNIKFLIGLRNQIVHKKARNLDSYLSARYQACALNYCYYLKKIFGNKYSLDNELSLAIQFNQLDYEQSQIIKNQESKIPKEIHSYIANFDSKLTDEEVSNNNFSYKILFTKINAKRRGQADRVIEFIEPNSEEEKKIEKLYVLKEDREKQKYRPKDVVEIINNRFPNYNFKIRNNTKLWQDNNAKDPNHGYGIEVCGQWFWYDSWIDFISDKINKKSDH